MKRLAPLAALLTLLLALTACGAASQLKEEAAPESETATLEELCGADYQSYIIDTITMQMENRMDKDPDVVYYPIAEKAPLTEYAATYETTAFQLEENGNLVILCPAGTVTDEGHGQQSFRILRP